MNFLYRCYTALMARGCFFHTNAILYRAALHGMGVMNCEDSLSGEKWFVSSHLKLPSDSVIFDVGANVGEFADLLRKAFPEAQIHAFEPQMQNFVELSARKGIHAHHLALGSREGDVEIYDYSGQGKGSAFATLYPEVFSKLHHAAATAARVPCMTIDSFCKHQRIDRIGLLKIDTEGAELDILKGASSMLAAGMIHNILFEFNEMNLISRAFMRDFRELLADYRLYRLLPRGLLRLPEQALLSEIFGYQNIVAKLDA